MDAKEQAAVTYGETLRATLDAVRGDGATIHQAGVFINTIYMRILAVKDGDNPAAVLYLENLNEVAARWLKSIAATAGEK